MAWNGQTFNCSIGGNAIMLYATLLHCVRHHHVNIQPYRVQRELKKDNDYACPHIVHS